jgi:hypothetical protein
MMMACSASDNLGPAHMVFLVGGAGNGKSRLAAEVVKYVNGSRVGHKSAFAQRSYEFNLPNGRGLRVLNDATIPPSDKHENALRRDISDALRGKHHFLGCINRGVLIGEQSCREHVSDGQDRIAADIIEWLLNGRFNHDDEENHYLFTHQELEGGHYLFAKVLQGGKPVAILHLVYMDSASLLEEWSDPPPMEQPDKPLPTSDLHLIPLLDPKRNEVAVGFESCLAGVSRGFLTELKANDLDPIAANASSLSKESVARGWCSLMRGAEILSGTHFSYRELWALSTHSLVGPVSSDAIARLSSHVAENVSKIQSRDISDRVVAAVALGNLRTHMMLFEAGTSSSNKTPGSFDWPETKSDAIKAVHFADPLKQFGPSTGSESSEVDVGLDGLNDGQRPGATLAANEAAIGDYWCKLDSKIEEILHEAIDPSAEAGLTSKQRSELLSWYGKYLYRLIALVRGWPAYVSVVSTWQDVWLDALYDGRLEPMLEEAVLNIVAPIPEGTQKALFTFLQPRVTQGEANAPKIRIEIPRNDMNLSVRVVGDRIDLEIRLRSQRKEHSPAATTLDFHLLREALAGREGYGFTDSRLTIEPRIERLRAAMVTAQIRAGGDRNRFNYSDRLYDETR